MNNNKLFTIVILLIAIQNFVFSNGSKEQAYLEDAKDKTVITIEHKFGETKVSGNLKRVVSVGYTEHDTLLALGIIPIAVRDWYGDMPNAVWPWAQEALGDNTLEVLSAAELDYEKIALLEPDIIVGISSGMTKKEYDLLSEIAPVIAQPGNYIDYGTPWQEVTKILGKVFDKVNLAEAIVSNIEQQFSEIKSSLVKYGKLTGAVSFVYQGKPGAYASQDSRSRIMEKIGINVPKDFDELAGGSFYITFSEERLDLLDTDIIIWMASSEQGLDEIRNLDLRNSLQASKDGRELFLGYILSGAFSFSSPLSLSLLLQEFSVGLELALDGNPATLVPESVR